MMLLVWHLQQARRANLNTIFYSIFTVAFALTGASYLYAPEATLKVGSLHSVDKHFGC